MSSDANTNSISASTSESPLRDNRCSGEKRIHIDSGTVEPHSKQQRLSTDEVTIPEVHSANAWEEANLGDDQRKAKFLKLMGANKKEHHGRFVIGENSKTPAAAPVSEVHTRSDSEEKGLEEKLEAQYKHSMEDHLKQRDRKHRGLGFQESAPAGSNNPQGPSHATSTKRSPHKESAGDSRSSEYSTESELSKASENSGDSCSAKDGCSSNKC